MTWFLTFYFLCQISLFVLFLSMYRDGSFKSSKKEEVCFAAVMLLFSPFGMLVVGIAWIYAVRLEKKKRTCNRLIAGWKNEARKQLPEKHDWFVNAADERCVSLRETVDCLSDNDIKLLLSMDQETLKIEDMLTNALVDELLRRKLSD